VHRGTRSRNTTDYLRRASSVLLVLVLLVGCGQEPSAEDSTAEETTTATAAASSSLDYVALGDSLATGYGATNGYVYHYANLLGSDTGATVNVYNLGVNGLTSKQLRAGIENDQRVKDTIKQAEVITIDIGANDLLRARWRYRTGDCGGADNQDCFRRAVGDFQTNWDAVLASVTGVRPPDTIIIRTMDFYNPLVDVDRATESWPNASANDFMVFKEYLEQVNSHIDKSSNTYGIPHARIYEAFNGPNGDEDPSSKGYMSSDGIHPSDDGHAAIAQELRKLAYKPLYN
jgi:lysophospholipase L1-like esterase